MAENDPEFGNENEYDASFVRTGFILIEEGLDANGEHAFRFRHTVGRPMALGLMQIVSDRLRRQEQKDWALAEEPDDEDGEEDEDAFYYDD